MTESKVQRCTATRPVKVQGATESIFTNFEAPTFSVGSPDGQNGWTRGPGYDHNIVTQSTYSSFGGQSLKISNFHTTGAFDQTYSKSLTNSVGETTASTGIFSAGTRRRRFVL